MNTQKQIEALETKLAEVSAELQRLKGQKAGQWQALRGEEYMTVKSDGSIGQSTEIFCNVDKRRHEIGNYFPDTPEGREAAEWFAFCEGFRARWKRSADKTPTQNGYVPAIDDDGEFIIYRVGGHYGLPKWSTTGACRAFVDSEGGPEKFKEILKRGIL